MFKTATKDMKYKQDDGLLTYNLLHVNFIIKKWYIPNKEESMILLTIQKQYFSPI